MGTTLDIPGLMGGGIVLDWRCNSQCRHCLYNCGPNRNDGTPSQEEVDSLLDALAEKGPRASYHLGGGEPFLDIDLLDHTIAGMSRRGLRLDYAETNARWARSDEEVNETLHRLHASGLECVLVSVSPFHAEFIPFERTKRLILAANKILPGGAFVWIPDFLKELSALDPAKTLDFDGLLAEQGTDWAFSLGLRYGLMPGGRGGRYMAACGRNIPWEELLPQAPCRERLRDTGHFHVDAQGRYIPRLCAGIVLPLEQVPGPVDLDPFPAVRTLYEEGLVGLIRKAEQSGFTPLERYAGPCDLCTHVRLHLVRHDPSPDLGPAGFYLPEFLPDFT